MIEKPIALDMDNENWLRVRFGKASNNYIIITYSSNDDTEVADDFYCNRLLDLTFAKVNRQTSEPWLSLEHLWSSKFQLK